MAKRTLKNLNLLDDFLFGTLVSHKEFGEAFCRELLQTIFQRKFGKLKVIPQRQYYGDDTVNHGTRLDVYLEEDRAELEPEALYDLEAENAKNRKKRQHLPKRARFYRAIVRQHTSCVRRRLWNIKRYIHYYHSSIRPIWPGPSHLYYT